jgi:hypothetical protein
MPSASTDFFLAGLPDFADFFFFFAIRPVYRFGTRFA